VLLPPLPSPLSSSPSPLLRRHATPPPPPTAHACTHTRYVALDMNEHPWRLLDPPHASPRLHDALDTPSSRGKGSCPSPDLRQHFSPSCASPLFPASPRRPAASAFSGPGLRRTRFRRSGARLLAPAVSCRLPFFCNSPKNNVIVALLCRVTSHTTRRDASPAAAPPMLRAVTHRPNTPSFTPSNPLPLCRNPHRCRRRHQHRGRLSERASTPLPRDPAPLALQRAAPRTMPRPSVRLAPLVAALLVGLVAAHAAAESPHNEGPALLVPLPPAPRSAATGNSSASVPTVPASAHAPAAPPHPRRLVAPSFTIPSASIDVADESPLLSTSVYRVLATDPDPAYLPSGVLTFSLTSSSPASGTNYFDVTQGTGDVVVTSSLKPVRGAVFVLTVSVRDGFGEVVASPFLLTITVRPSYCPSGASTQCGLSMRGARTMRAPRSAGPGPEPPPPPPFPHPHHLISTPTPNSISALLPTTTTTTTISPLPPPTPPPQAPSSATSASPASSPKPASPSPRLTSRSPPTPP
jgi:hypothetical protein